MTTNQVTSVWFFVGPSVPADTFAAACGVIDADVRVLPPIQQGDLLRHRPPDPDVIGIVDGSFFQVPAVSHKEILATLERGVRVLGASSLGALRAAELDRFGMEGVGEVYRLYRRGIVDADDEVAVLHASAEEGYRPLTVPLVEIRHNLRLAPVSRATKAGVLAAAKRLHFTERTYEAALAASSIAPGEGQRLRDFLATAAVDLKREDALALVRLVADRVAGRSPWPPFEPPRTAHTVFLHLFERAYAGEDGLPDALVLSLHRVLSPTFPSDGPRFMVPGIPWERPLIRAMKATGEFAAAREAARHVVRQSELLAAEVPGLAHAWSDERLEGWLAARWGVGPDRLDRAMWARGVTDYRELLHAVRLAYAAEVRGRLSPPPPPAGAAP